jgi:ABC-2 type transport system permease protein
MITQWRLARAVVARDARIALSYRTGFLLSTVGSLGSVVMVFFLSQTVGAGDGGTLDPYARDYFGFVVVGLAFTTLMALGLNRIGTEVRQGQLMGTLEMIVLSPIPLAAVLTYTSLWGYLLATINVVLYLAVGVVLGVDLSHADVPAAIIAVILAILAFDALGLLAAAVVIVIKQGNPVTWLVTTASMLLAGVFYPISVLPDPLQAIGKLLPLTHALEIIRRALLTGATVTDLLPSFIALVVLTAALIPVGVVGCAIAVRIARTDGSLSQY